MVEALPPATRAAIAVIGPRGDGVADVVVAARVLRPVLVEDVPVGAA